MADKVRNKEPTVAGEVIRLFIKIIIICGIFLLLFTFMFGVTRSRDNSMSPAVNDADLVIYYRPDKRYVAGNTLVMEYEGEKQIRRVIAVEGDTVDITEEGLMINGSLQHEGKIYTETMPYTEGIEFPITVSEGEVFVLGDNRIQSIDSRIYGVVKVSDTKGKVMTIIRRREI